MIFKHFEGYFKNCVSVTQFKCECHSVNDKLHFLKSFNVFQVFLSKQPKITFCLSDILSRIGEVPFEAYDYKHEKKQICMICVQNAQTMKFRGKLSKFGTFSGLLFWWPLENRAQHASGHVTLRNYSVYDIKKYFLRK